MNSIRILENPSRCMQRLGFLKYLISRAAQTTTSSMKSFGNDLVQTLTNKVTVSVTPELAEYVQEALTDRVYRPLRETVAKALQEGDPSVKVSVELQDAYLADQGVPSKRGKLVAGDWRKYPYLALGLGLMREKSYSILVRGQLFLKLVNPQEITAFRVYASEANPLLLSTSQKLFFLFTLVEHDADVFLPLFGDLLTNQSTFSDREAGDLLPNVLHTAHSRLRSKVRTGADAARLQKLSDTAQTIEQWRGRTYSGKGAREETITPRLEPLVDLGILGKDSPFLYRYEFTQAGRSIMRGLAEAEDLDALDTRFFSLTTKEFGLSRDHLSRQEDIVDAIYQGFRNLASPLGYAPIREALLLSVLTTIDQGLGYFEMAEALESLRAVQRQYPNVVRFSVDRWGNVNFVKFLGHPLGGSR
jgi:hypothetical protein